MGKFQSFAASVTLGVLYARMVSASIGPTADMTISNADVSPDGFTRAAVVVNDVMPGPLVVGNKVRLSGIASTGRSTLMRLLHTGGHLPDQRHRQPHQRDHVDGHHHREPFSRRPSLDSQWLT